MFRRIAIAIGIVIVTILVVRSYDAARSPPLKLWHTQVPHELDVSEIDSADWEAWVVAENAAFAEVQKDVIDALPADDHISINRYFAECPANPQRFAQNWNHSFVLTPVGTPRGAVVLLHGLTDSPYRHAAHALRTSSMVTSRWRFACRARHRAGGLTTTRWEAWLAATRLAVRTRTMAGDKVPLHLVGYSNGGALALKYALDSLSDPKLARPDRLVLLSPMVGITRLCAFRRVLGW
jgi:predicted alpha/beta-fold hydrolase